MAVQTAVITQGALQAIHDLEAELVEKTATLEEMKNEVKQLLFAKAPLEPGRFDARLSFNEDAQRPVETSRN